MGDSGSMFVGFFLASSALMNLTGGRSRSLAPVIAVPVLILFIPIFDTTFVTILRKVSGRAASQGGRDHTSHRLVALGLSERRAVWMLYGFAALAGVLGLSVQSMKLDVSLAAITAFTVLLTLLGVYLAGVKVYDETEEALAVKDQSPYGFLIDLSYKRRIFEVLLDIILILLSYWCAYALKFGAFSGNNAWKLFLRTLPVLVFVKMAAFLATGVYRGIWRYTGLDNLIVFAKGVALSSVLSVLVILFAFRFEGFSRTIFIIDALLMFMFLAASRMAFRLFRQVLPTSGSGEGRRVLIYGAGDAGEMVLRELMNNRALKYSPVAFLDDDPAKKGKVIHGLKVYAANGDLNILCRQHKANELLISINSMPQERLQQIIDFGRTHDIAIKRMRINIEDLS
jgi:UDP-GlcNAc:undecaprenyl-phosphate/decaprenyl-phosphate GlcNAc-1-phosphate transferase